jgi:hypothetical protein
MATEQQTSQGRTIDVLSAVKAAESYARMLYPEDELRSLRLEEVELSPDEGHWDVTLGWVEPAVRSVGGLSLGGVTAIQKLPRVYKLFRVDAATGEVLSMKIRDVD